jgi:NADPH2:quinone reductase
MQAVVVREFGGPEVLRVEDVPVPVPGPGQVRLRVRAVGVNPVDTYIRAGAYARKPALPYTPGADVGGEVEALGDGVTGLSAGDRVYGFAVAAACAEYAVCDAWQVRPLPARVSFAQGAAIGIPYGTAWRALFGRAEARPGEHVLVHGASGGVGLAAVQMARAHGMRVIGTAGSAEGLALVTAQGAHHVVNHRELGYEARILACTGGRGADVVLEMLANVNLDRDLDLLAMYGRIVVIGNRGRVEIDPRKAMSRDAAILGMIHFTTPRPALEEIHAGIGAGLELGTLTPVIRMERPLADAAAAHIAVMEPGALGKIVLVP